MTLFAASAAGKTCSSIFIIAILVRFPDVLLSVKRSKVQSLINDQGRNNSCWRLHLVALLSTFPFTKLLQRGSSVEVNCQLWVRKLKARMSWVEFVSRSMSYWRDFLCEWRPSNERDRFRADWISLSGRLAGEWFDAGYRCAVLERGTRVTVWSGMSRSLYRSACPWRRALLSAAAATASVPFMASHHAYSPNAPFQLDLR